MRFFFILEKIFKISKRKVAFQLGANFRLKKKKPAKFLKTFKKLNHFDKFEKGERVLHFKKKKKNYVLLSQKSKIRAPSSPC